MSCENPYPGFSDFHRRIRFCASLVVAMLLLTAAQAALSVTEMESNNTCATAQNAGTLSANASITVTGALTTPPDIPDVDFYKFTATPGTLLQVVLTGVSDAVHTLEQPIAEALNSSCGYLYSSGPADPLSFQIAVPADGVVVVAVSSSFDFGFTGVGFYAGTYTLAATQVTPVQSISGRALDAATGQPIAGVQASIAFCRDPTCVTGDFIGYFYTDPSGQFTFTNSIFGTPLAPGDYQVTLTDYSGRYVTAQSPIFPVASAEQKVLPDIAMAPTPVIGSIRGRIIDSVTRAPLSGISTPYAHISIFGCAGLACTSLDGFADSMGRFRFDRDQSGRGIVAGASYNAFVTADQYQQLYKFIAPIDVGVNQDLGNIELVSNPIRFNVLHGCSSVPLTGGVCRYEVEITNGIANHVRGSAWATINANGLASFVGGSVFQTGEPQEMNLAAATRKRRSSRTAIFEFAIPGSVPTYAFICPTFWFGVEPGNPQLYVQGALADYTACVQRTATGFTPATPEQTNALRKEAREHEARERAKVLPKRK